MKTPRISVILPTYNEKYNIKEMIKQVLKYLKDDVEVIVVDDNSPDLTWKIVQNMKNPRVKVIRRIHERGVASAIMKGIKNAKGKYVAWMDADLSMPPSLLPEMVKNLSEYDVVVGSRYAKGGGDARDFIRRLTSRALNLFANFVLNFKVLDYDTGFVVTRKEIVEEIGFDPSGHGQYCIEFLYKCTKRGYKIKEIGFVFTERKVGKSKTSYYVGSILLHGFKYISRILKVKFSS